jgi:hypothetical protein
VTRKELVIALEFLANLEAPVCTGLRHEDVERDSLDEYIDCIKVKVSLKGQVGKGKDGENEEIEAGESRRACEMLLEVEVLGIELGLRYPCRRVVGICKSTLVVA